MDKLITINDFERQGLRQLLEYCIVSEEILNHYGVDGYKMVGQISLWLEELK